MLGAKVYLNLVQGSSTQPIANIQTISQKVHEFVLGQVKNVKTYLVKTGYKAHKKTYKKTASLTLLHKIFKNYFKRNTSHNTFYNKTLQNMWSVK